MTIAIIAAILLCIAAVHEAAHALVLRGYGIPISEAGLGVPLPPRVVFTIPRIPFTLAVSPWLFGAYVSHDPQHNRTIQKLPYLLRAWYLNAGIVANLVLGAGLLAVGRATAGRPVSAAVWAAVATVVWLARRPIAAYVLPALAVPALILMGVLLANAWAAGSTGFGYAGLGELAPHGLTETLGFAGALSMAIAIINALPLFGLDNGKVVGLLVERWFSRRVTRVYEYAGITLVLASLALAVVSDVWAAVT